jgi:hypothetical protein
MSNVKTWSDPSSHPILGSATEKPTGGISDFKQTANKDGSNTVTFNSTMSGANPLVPGSPEAVANFCSCPVMDNAEMPNDKKWVNGDCPLHGKVK